MEAPAQEMDTQFRSFRYLREVPKRAFAFAKQPLAFVNATKDVLFETAAASWQRG